MTRRLPELSSTTWSQCLELPSVVPGPSLEHLLLQGPRAATQGCLRPITLTSPSSMASDGLGGSSRLSQYLDLLVQRHRLWMRSHQTHLGIPILSCSWPVSSLPTRQVTRSISLISVTREHETEPRHLHIAVQVISALRFSVSSQCKTQSMQRHVGFAGF